MSVFTRLESTGRFLIAAWILAYFLLPDPIRKRFPFDAMLQHWGADAPFLVLAFALLALCVGVVFLLARQSTAVRENNTLPLWLLTAFYFVPSLLTLFAYQNRATLFESVSSLLVALGSGLLCAFLCGKSGRVVLLICLFGLAQGIFTIYYQKMGISTVAPDGMQRAGGTFGNSGSVYTLMMLGVPLAVAQALQIVEAHRKAFWLLCASVMFAALILTWHWGGALAVALALTWLAAHFIRDKYSVIGIGAFLLCGVVLMAQHGIGGFSQRSPLNDAIMGNAQSWQRGLIVFENNWLAGTGIGVLSTPVTVGMPVPGIKPITIGIASNSLLLRWLDELGIGGGILFLLFAVAIYQMLRRSQDEPVVLGLSAAWIALLVAGIFDTPFGTGERSCGNALVGCLLGATALLRANKPVPILEENVGEIRAPAE